MRRSKLLPAALTALALLASPGAGAQDPTPDSVAPPLSFCFGKTATCVLPDVGLQVVNYDLDAKKWSGGVKKLDLGYALLFAADESYGSGVALHFSFSLGQAVPNYFAPTLTLVLARYFQFGATFELGDGYLKKALTVGSSVPTDLLSGSTLYSRLLAARRVRAAETSPEPPAPPPPPPAAPDAGAADAPAATESPDGGAQ